MERIFIFLTPLRATKVLCIVFALLDEALCHFTGKYWDIGNWYCHFFYSYVFGCKDTYYYCNMQIYNYLFYQRQD